MSCTFFNSLVEKLASSRNISPSLLLSRRRHAAFLFNIQKDARDAGSHKKSKKEEEEFPSD